MNLPTTGHVRHLADGRDGRHAGTGVAERWSATSAVAPLWALVLVLACWPAPVHADDLNRAIELANEGRYQAAHQQIAPILEAQPEHFRARLLQGILRAREGRLDDAVRLFEALRDTYPERSEPYNNLAAVYVAQDRLDDAHGALLSAIARKPELPTAHDNLADLYLRLARRSTLRARGLTGAPETDGNLAMDEPPADQVPALVVSDLGVVAADVADDDAASTTPLESVDPVAPPPSSQCVRVTGLPDAAEVADAAAWLESHGAAVQQRQDRAEKIRDHWVFLPPLSSRAEATARLEEMRADGVEDIAVVRHGDRANGISLGVYRSTDNMRRRVAALEDMGYPVQYETMLETVVTYGLEAEFSALPAFVRADWAAEFPEYVLETSECDPG